MTTSDDSLARLETLLGRLLVTGITLSAALLLIGLVLWMIAGEAGPAPAVLNAGLMALMATPMTRVVVSFVEYVRERDWFFAGTTLAVLLVLAGTVWVALST